MPADAALAVVEQAAALGAEQLSLGGGEPTASPLLGRLLRLTASLGMRCEVFTCGLRSAHGKVAPLSADVVAVMSRVGQLKAIFTVHAPDASLHDYITGRAGSFDCLLRSLEACLAAEMHCELNFVPVRPNAQTFADVVRLADAHGIPRLSVLRFVPQGRGLLNRAELELSRDEEDKFVRTVLQLRRESGADIRTGSPFNGIVPGNVVPCRAGAGKLVVQADGNVLPCEVFKHAERRSWGLSVRDASLGEILASGELADLRRTLRRADCLECPVHRRLRQLPSAGGSPRDEQVPEAPIHA